MFAMSEWSDYFGSRSTILSISLDKGCTRPGASGVQERTLQCETACCVSIVDWVIQTVWICPIGSAADIKRIMHCDGFVKVIGIQWQYYVLRIAVSAAV